MNDMKTIRPAHVPAIPLSGLVRGTSVTGDVSQEVTVTGVTLDSRSVTPGCVYVGLPGTRMHGATFASAAARAGAVAVLTDPEGRDLADDAGIPVLTSVHLRRDMALISRRVFGAPGDRLELFGVTGTNGKTTTVALLEAGLLALGRRAGTIGTVGFRLDGVPVPSGRGTVTTPDSPDLQALLAVMEERGAQAVALEVSSHALVLERVTGLRFDVAAFLNLGHDHLDFHPDVEAYFEAKASLFTPEMAARAVCWTDDVRGAEVARRSRLAGIPVWTVGTDESCDFRLGGYEPVAPLGGRAQLEHAGQAWQIRIALPGYHNMIDAAVALAMLAVAGHPVDIALEGLAVAQVPGRMQQVVLPGEAPCVIVDFAHTPQAVTATLRALRESFDHVVTVIGCGGDRDAAKRPEMGRAAAALSQVVIITDDNPRSEDPGLIRRATMAGAVALGGDAQVEEVAGRRTAIERALGLAGPRSVVAILGKGHEQGQEVAGRILPFDDTVEARDAWARLRGATT